MWGVSSSTTLAGNYQVRCVRLTLFNKRAHRHTHTKRGVTYSRSFVVTLAIAPVPLEHMWIMTGCCSGGSLAREPASCTSGTDLMLQMTIKVQWPLTDGREC
jgi:hypothetical protein